jgi:hypothetical protein
MAGSTPGFTGDVGVDPASFPSTGGAGPQPPGSTVPGSE